MKNQKINLLSLVCFLFLGISFVSCSDDDDEYDGGDVVSKVANFTYKANYTFADDLLSIANITMYYINEEGRLSSEVVTTSNWQKTVKTSELPFIMNTYYTIQNKNVELTKDSYDLTVKRSLEYFAEDVSGKQIAYNKLDRNRSLKVGANKIPLFFEKYEGPNVDEYNYSVSLNETGDGIVVVPIVQ